VDVEEAFHQAVRGGIGDEDLFVDVCHPSFLGHVITGQVFLAKLLELEPFSNWSTDDPPIVTASTDWRELADHLYREMGVTPEDEAVAIAGNILWYFDITHFFAYPDRCVAEIQKLIRRLEEVCGEQKMARTFAAVSRARLAIRANDKETSLREINRALAVSPRHLETIMELKAWNHFVGDEFEQAGIHYSASDKAFMLAP
jgi:hypothetical protein